MTKTLTHTLKIYNKKIGIIDQLFHQNSKTGEFSQKNTEAFINAREVARVFEYMELFSVYSPCTCEFRTISCCCCV